jgi:hypothetical protein
MPLTWQFLLDRGVNFRTKRLLLAARIPGGPSRYAPRLGRLFPCDCKRWVSRMGA